MNLRAIALTATGAALMLAAILTWNTLLSLAQVQTSGGCRTFPQTNHKACGKFLQYWQSHGGLAQQGYPLSEEFTEKSDLDGKPYTMQYFERAVFELHPENKPPYDLLLSQLGTFRAHEKYPNGFPNEQQTPFLEDRTDPLKLLQSFYNAVNRREYQRAYSYFEAGSIVEPYAQFAQGYSDTASVTYVSGPYFTEGAAGSTFANVPVVITATHTDGDTLMFYGCYTLRHTDPGIDPNPDAVLWRIYSANIMSAPANVPANDLLARSCKK